MKSFQEVGGIILKKLTKNNGKISLLTIADICFFLYLFCELRFKHSLLGQLGVLLIIFAGFLLIAIYRKANSSFYFPIMLLFMLYGFYISYSKYAINRVTSLEILSSVFVNLLIMFFVFNYLTLRSNIDLSMSLYVKAVLFYSIVIIFFEPASISGNRLGGANSNVLAISTSIALVISIYKFILNKKEKGNIFKIVFFLIITLLTGSRKGLLAVLLGSGLLIYFIYPNKRFKNIFLMSIGVLLVYMTIMSVPFLFNTIGIRLQNLLDFIFHDKIVEDSIKSRLTLVEIGQNYISKRFWQGYGLGSFMYIPLSGGTYSHNNYIELLFSVGFIGTSIYYTTYLVAIFQCFKLIKKHYKMASCLISILLVLLVLDYGWVSYIERLPLTIFMFVLAYIKIQKQIFKEVTKL